jgi:hypothetical protein
MTMGIPPTGHSTGSVDDARVDMDLEETSASVAGQLVQKSGSKEALRLAHTSTSRLARTSTSTTTTTTTMMGSENGRSTGSVDDARVDMDMEEITGAVVRKLVEKSGSTSLQKEASRSAGTSTTATTTTTGMQKIGDPTGCTEKAVDAAEFAVELEETTTEAAVGQPMADPKSTSLNKKEVVRSAHTSTTTTTTGMQKIDEGNEEENKIQGMKTRNWRKIILSFAIELNGQEGEDIR